MSFPSLLTTAEVASLLRVDPRTIERWCQEGRLRPIRLAPRSVRYRADEIAALIDPSSTSNAAGANRGVAKVVTGDRNEAYPTLEHLRVIPSRETAQIARTRR
jgi:excisionase family DNA binding protein